MSELSCTTGIKVDIFIPIPKLLIHAATESLWSYHHHHEDSINTTGISPHLYYTQQTHGRIKWYSICCCDMHAHSYHRFGYFRRKNVSLIKFSHA